MIHIKNKQTNKQKNISPEGERLPLAISGNWVPICLESSTQVFGKSFILGRQSQSSGRRGERDEFFSEEKEKIDSLLIY